MYLTGFIESIGELRRCVSYAANGPKGGDNRQIYAKYFLSSSDTLKFSGNKVLTHSSQFHNVK